MFLATINKAERLLLLSYFGKVTAEELRRGREEWVPLLAELPKGFRILGDFGRLDSMDPDCAPEIGKMMELADKKGVELVVRVVPDPSKDIGLNILAMFHYKRRVPAVTCETMEEAAQALEI